MTVLVLRGDARQLPLADASVDLIVTSPPYWALRDYRDGDASLVGQIGAEATPQAYVEALLECTREWMRVLKPTGSLFVNLGDKYAVRAGQGGPQGSTGQRASRKQAATYEQQPDRAFGVQTKSLIGLPWRYALACIDDLDLILRAEIVWSKPNGLPESVTDRVRRAHEHWFHLVKQPRYFAAVDEIRLPLAAPERVAGRSAFGARDISHRRTGTGSYDGQNPLGALPGSVWEVATQPLKAPTNLGVDHFAAFPPALVRRIILGWSPPGVCTACGEGRCPVTVTLGRESLRDLPLLDSHERKNAEGAWHDGIETSTLARPGWRKEGLPQRKITGYACACPEPTAPTRAAVVLDPFGGTGTTAMTADVLGRTGISIDLSADYGRLAQWRTADPRERARALGVAPPPPVADEQGDLFDIEPAR